MQIIWTDEAWDDYLHWQANDKKLLRRINQLIKDIERNGNVGIGKPEPLKYDFSGWWSRHIDDTHRLIYRIEDNNIIVSHCRTHYESK